MQGRGKRPLRAGGGSGEECGTTLPRERGLQGECGTMTLPLSAQEGPLPGAPGGRGSGAVPRANGRPNGRRRRRRNSGCLVSKGPDHPSAGFTRNLLPLKILGTHLLTIRFGGQKWWQKNIRSCAGFRACHRAIWRDFRRIGCARVAISVMWTATVPA